MPLNLQTQLLQQYEPFKRFLQERAAPAAEKGLTAGSNLVGLGTTQNLARRGMEGVQYFQGQPLPPQGGVREGFQALGDAARLGITGKAVGGAMKLGQAATRGGKFTILPPSKAALSHRIPETLQRSGQLNPQIRANTLRDIAMKVQGSPISSAKDVTNPLAKKIMALKPNTITEFKTQVTNLLQKEGAGNLLPRAHESFTNFDTIYRSAIAERMPLPLWDTAKTTLKGFGAFFGGKKILEQLKPKAAQAQTFGDLTPENKEIVKSMVNYTANPNTGTVSLPTMENLQSVIEDWAQTSTWPRIPDWLAPPFHFVPGTPGTPPDKFINFNPDAFVGGPENNGVMISFEELSNLFLNGGEGNFYETLWMKPDGSTQQGGVLIPEFQNRISEGWRPIKIIMAVDRNYPPNKPMIAPPDGTFTQPTAPLQRPYLPLPPGTTTTMKETLDKFAGNIKKGLSVIRESVIPTVQAASPGEIAEVKDTLIGSKTFNLSKAKKLSSKDILKAIETIEKKANLQFSGDPTKRAIFIALAMNRQLGNQSPFQDWEQRNI